MRPTFEDTSEQDSTNDIAKHATQEIAQAIPHLNHTSVIVHDCNLHDRLWALARNLWWTWHPEVISFFRELDPIRWRQLDHNPIALLSEFTSARLEERVDELVLRSSIDHAYRRLQEYLHSENTWGAGHAGVLRVRPVAYFSAEFGLHESLPIYSGGLGVLAGDHLKSASDLDVPLIAVGLFYDQGYFLQRVNHDGWQEEAFVTVNVDRLPLQPTIGPGGQPLIISIETRTGTVSAHVWKLQVGRNTLLLLDSAIKGNCHQDQELTARLYSGDNQIRIRQELLLGVGGIRALRALNITPGVLHLNEGHSAFAGLELVRDRMQTEGIGFEEAMYRVANQVVFTMHTPVSAGHDRFSPDLVEEHLGPLREALGLSLDKLLGLGRVDPRNSSELFCMTVLALKMSRRANAVSALHGWVSRRMWAGLWLRRPVEEVPIGHVTNGVHGLSWLAPQMQELYDRHLGVNWKTRSGEKAIWTGIQNVDDGELWETHQVLKARLVDFVRRRVAQQCERRGDPAEIIQQGWKVLSNETLTIGFARRFASYKRASLLMHNLERLSSLINDSKRPIQVVFAGKAHPKDVEGKQVLQQICRLCQDPLFVGKVVFVEDYDINTGRHLVQGVDVWMNTPRRPLEASGTSGQKVVLNGGLNLSVLDGWWAEGFDGLNGFAVGAGGNHISPDVQDCRDAENLYYALEKEVIPLYYERDRHGLPRAWIARMKHAIRSLGWRFNADRMVMDYLYGCYLPAAGGVSCELRNPTVFASPDAVR
jgi:starch phosphorylase